LRGTAIWEIVHDPLYLTGFDNPFACYQIDVKFFGVAFSIVWIPTNGSVVGTVFAEFDGGITP
jgi:hypothetical protein